MSVSRYKPSKQRLERMNVTHSTTTPPKLAKTLKYLAKLREEAAQREAAL